MATQSVSRTLRWAAPLVAVALTTAQALGSSVALDTLGFETYNLGPLAGQQGWLGVGGPGGAAFVQSSVVHSGTKAVQVNRGAGSDNFWAVPLGGSYPTGRFMLVDWDMNVVGTGATDGRLGPFFGVEAYDDIGIFGRLGGFGVDATTGEVLFLKSDPGGAILSDTADETVLFNTWNHFAMLFDFTSSRYSLFLNGVRLLDTPFADPGLNQFTDADIVAYAAAADSGSMLIPGTAYFDNFRVLNGLPGDFDQDGDVDADDLPIWKAAYGTTAAGDADGNLITDGNDFLIWQRNLGVDLTPATAASGAVPEPSGALLAGLALLAAARRAAPRR
ncbi:MAG TPA: hypothetical protein PJ982_17040 [Lacipirellulaceae bacterium]|nr:hypothetical protein [Lacipirellulaceae bacterium]